MALFLVITFVLHGVAFAVLGLKRRRIYYFFLTAAFAFLTAVHVIKFEGWSLSVPGTDFPVTWILRIGASLCTLMYLGLLCREPGSWLWKLRRRLPSLRPFVGS